MGGGSIAIIVFTIFSLASPLYMRHLKLKAATND